MYVFIIYIFKNHIYKICFIILNMTMIPPTNSTWHSDDYVSTFRLVDICYYSNLWSKLKADYIHFKCSLQTCNFLYSDHYIFIF